MKKTQYISPRLRAIVIEDRLLETVSGKDQEGIDMGESKSYNAFDFDDYDEYEL